jgi:hypothetical protein
MSASVSEQTMDSCLHIERNLCSKAKRCLRHNTFRRADDCPLRRECWLHHRSVFQHHWRYRIFSEAGAALYDFPVVVPGSGGGTINGDIFNDPAGNGTWDPSYSGVSGNITVYVGLNHYGQLDPAEVAPSPTGTETTSSASRSPGVHGLHSGWAAIRPDNARIRRIGGPTRPGERH